MGSLTPLFTLSVELRTREADRPSGLHNNGRVGCKEPTDLVKISDKEAMHMCFYYSICDGLFCIWTQCAIAYCIIDARIQTQKIPANELVILW